MYEQLLNTFGGAKKLELYIEEQILDIIENHNLASLPDRMFRHQRENHNISNRRIERDLNADDYTMWFYTRYYQDGRIVARFHNRERVLTINSSHNPFLVKKLEAMARLQLRGIDVRLEQLDNRPASAYSNHTPPERDDLRDEVASPRYNTFGSMAIDEAYLNRWHTIVNTSPLGESDPF